MARSGSIFLEEIDEKFCQCPICLQQYREPKQLPCLHRYCSNCLKELIKRNQGVDVISCPECRDDVILPTEGVDGFKTDFHMKNIIDYIQLQKSLGEEKVGKCYGCSRNINVTSYCFKCKGSLCEECYKFHLTNQSLKEHKQHVISLDDLKSKHMTLENIYDLKESPSCQSHMNDLCLLCCKTCNELPICVACVHGIHKNHDIDDVKVIAAEKREKLQHELSYLNQYKERILKMPQTVEKIKGNITANFKARKETFKARYGRASTKVKSEIEKIDKDFQRSWNEIGNSKQRELAKNKKQMDEEIKHIKIKYENMSEEIEKKSKIKFDNLIEEKKGNIQKIKEKLAILKSEFKSSTDTLVKEHEKRISKLDKISQEVVGIIARYESLTATGVSVIDTGNDWTAVQCIPDVRKAIGPLITDMKKEFPELDQLSRIGVELEEDEESAVSISGISTDKFDSIASVGGSIVITGRTTTQFQSHITVIKINGEVLHRRKLEGKYQSAIRHCAYLSEFQIATVCWLDEIGVFDIHSNSYKKMNISEIIKSWPRNRNVTCVTTDHVNKHIFVGSYGNKDVYVFDAHLSYHHTLSLPEIKYPSDMAFNEGKLLVCDPVNKSAYVVTIMNGQIGKVTQELTKPDSEGDDLYPLSVFIDSNGLIYILWMAGSSYTPGKRIIVQYAKDGSKSLQRKVIDKNDTRSLLIVKTNLTEKLLVATWSSGKLHVYTIS